MSETLVLVFVDAEVSVGDIARSLGSLGRVYERESGLVVRAGSDVCFLVKVDDPSVDGVFDDWPAHLLPAGRSTIFSMDYRSIEFAVRVVHVLADEYRLVVDTNYRLVLPGGELTSDVLASGYPRDMPDAT